MGDNSGEETVVKITALRRGDLDRALLADGRADRLSWWGDRLSLLGIAPGAAGNLSFRSERGYVVTRTGVELDSIEPGDWVEVIETRRRADGGLEVVYCGDHEPSSDAFVHGTVYERQPGAQAIFHLHDQQMLDASDRLGIASTDEFFPAGTDESVAEIERFLGGHPQTDYFVLVSHGIVAWGAAIDEVGARVEEEHRRSEGRDG